jgi:hypothetical protein
MEESPAQSGRIRTLIHRGAVFRGHAKTTMIYTHVLKRGPAGVTALRICSKGRSAGPQNVLIADEKTCTDLLSGDRGSAIGTQKWIQAPYEVFLIGFRWIKHLRELLEADFMIRA